MVIIGIDPGVSGSICFFKDGICYANMNYISNPEFKGIDTSQVLKIKID